jgi:hypothetical protein
MKARWHSRRETKNPLQNFLGCNDGLKRTLFDQNNASLSTPAGKLGTDAPKNL